MGSKEQLGPGVGGLGMEIAAKEEFKNTTGRMEKVESMEEAVSYFTGQKYQDVNCRMECFFSSYFQKSGSPIGGLLELELKKENIQIEIRAAEVEEELACARCRYCNSEERHNCNMFDTHLPPLHLLKWTRDASLQPQLVFVNERPISPPCARIARTPPLFRTSVIERVAEVE